MEERSAVHSTFIIQRNYPVPPERVFSAFSDPAMKRRWFVEGENKVVDTFEMDFRAGGMERARYHYVEGKPFRDAPFTHEGIFQHIIPNRCIVGSSTMTLGGKTISAALTTVDLVPDAEGTKVIFTFQGAFFEGSDGPEMREKGWQTLLDRLGTVLGGQ